MSDNTNLRSKLWGEIEPVVNHALTVLALEISLVLIGLIGLILGTILPDQKEYIDYLEIIDIWIALALLCMFGAYTIIRVLIRLLRGIRDEWKQR
jgi:putative Mn2+ efflux pump MntP